MLNLILNFDITVLYMTEATVLKLERNKKGSRKCALSLCIYLKHDKHVSRADLHDVLLKSSSPLSYHLPSDLKAMIFSFLW